MRTCAYKLESSPAAEAQLEKLVQMASDPNLSTAGMLVGTGKAMQTLAAIALLAEDDATLVKPLADACRGMARVFNARADLLDPPEA